MVIWGDLEQEQELERNKKNGGHESFGGWGGDLVADHFEALRIASGRRLCFVSVLRIASEDAE